MLPRTLPGLPSIGLVADEPWPQVVTPQSDNNGDAPTTKSPLIVPSHLREQADNASQVQFQKALRRARDKAAKIARSRETVASCRPFSRLPFAEGDCVKPLPVRAFQGNSSATALFQIGQRDPRFEGFLADVPREALTAVGLHPGEILGRFPHQLSGGQRQRINVARALLLRPRLLIADEPVSMVDASLRANILETLSNLQKNYGVSIIYITHDLTTAYHISKSIVLYRGSVMEAGEVDAVIKHPQHPYTQLLIDSIPWPDISRRWGETELKAKESEITDHSSGCKFYARCPFAMEKCLQPPPLFRLSEHQAASCFLYDTNPAISSEQLTQLLPV